MVSFHKYHSIGTRASALVLPNTSTLKKLTLLNITMPSSEHTPLMPKRSAESAAERGLVGVTRAISPNKYKHQHRNNNIESGDVLQVKKIKQRKNVRSFRRKRQDFATWKGRSKLAVYEISANAYGSLSNIYIIYH